MKLELVSVRCPYCGRLAAKVSVGATVESKCSRCGALFEREANARQYVTQDRDDAGTEPGTPERQRQG